MKLTHINKIHCTPKLLPNKLMTELILGIVYPTYQHMSCCRLIWRNLCHNGNWTLQWNFRIVRDRSNLVLDIRPNLKTNRKTTDVTDKTLCSIKSCKNHLQLSSYKIFWRYGYRRVFEPFWSPMTFLQVCTSISCTEKLVRKNPWSVTISLTIVIPRSRLELVKNCKR